jgi:hypothetical protein
MNTFKLNPLSKSLAVAALLGLGAALVAPKAQALTATANLAVSAAVSAIARSARVLSHSGRTIQSSPTRQPP